MTYLALCWVLFPLAHHTIFHLDAATAWATSDAQGVRLGYHEAPNLFRDSLAWWQGSWIDKGNHFYRPVASYTYWIQVWLAEHYGWPVEAVAEALLGGAACAAFGLFTAAFTRNFRLGAVGAVSGCLAGAFNSSDPTRWWLVSDLSLIHI